MRTNAQIIKQEKAKQSNRQIFLFDFWRLERIILIQTPKSKRFDQLITIELTFEGQSICYLMIWYPLQMNPLQFGSAAIKFIIIECVASSQRFLRTRKNLKAKHKSRIRTINIRRTFFFTYQNQIETNFRNKQQIQLKKQKVSQQ